MKFFFTNFLIVFSVFLLKNNAWAQSTISGTVKDDKKLPLPEAIILVEGTNISSIADEAGHYQVSVPPDAKALIFTYIGYQAVTKIIGTETLIDVELTEGLDMTGVTVIGSRNASRTRIESAVPVDIIPIRSVANEVGQVEISQILHYIAPSFQSNRQTISDGTDHIDPATLRGLGPDQVLVLINGKRRHTSALVNINGTVGRGTVGTDMNAIPAHAIERIEILRDGAAAQYGSDAIAGVINIVLKKDVNRLSAVVSSGVTKAGDGLNYTGSLNYGLKIGKKGFINASLEYNQRGATNRMKQHTGPVWTTDKFSSATQETDYANPAKPYRGKGVDNATAYNGNLSAKAYDDSVLVAKNLSRKDFNMRIGNSQVSSVGAILNFCNPFSDALELYAFATFNQKNGNAAGFYRLPNESRNVKSIYPNGFLPNINTNILDYSGAIGLRGKLKDWNYDLSSVYGASRLNYLVTNSLNASLQGASPTEFDAGGLTFTQNTTNLEFTRHSESIFSGANFALGAEYRTDKYDQVNGEEKSYLNYGLVKYVGANGQDSVVDKLKLPGGAQVFPGFRPENNIGNTRSNLSVYADMEADFTPHLMLGVALRYEKYSDFGETQNYKLVGKYKFNKQVMVRGAANTGFRAPSQQQKFFNTTSTQFNSLGQPFEVGTFRNDSPIAAALGIPTLKEETSINYSLGAAFKLNDDFEMTIDGYQVEIKNRIILTGQFEGLKSKTASGFTYYTTPQDSILAGLLLKNNAQKAAFFTNAVDTKTYGLDIVASYHLKIHKNDFRFVLACNFNKNDVVGAVKTTELLKNKVGIYFNREDRSRLEVVNPNSKITFSINWKHEKWWMMLRNVYFGQVSYIDPSIDPAKNGSDYPLNVYTGNKETLDQVFTPKTVTDLTIGYQVAPFCTVSLGANNLFDIYPDAHAHSVNDNFGRFDYSRRVTQFGFNGAYYFARIVFDIRQK
ncbi:MAG: hypothetical protein RI894_1134 [Bacteroidota bacterium]|jgi:iron complex outermembrane receptor protein